MVAGDEREIECLRGNVGDPAAYRATQITKNKNRVGFRFTAENALVQAAMHVAETLEVGKNSKTSW